MNLKKIFAFTLAETLITIGIIGIVSALTIPTLIQEYKKVENKIGRICGVIMLITTIIFLVWGFTLNMWYINWVVYPVGGILCGIVGTIFKKDNT